MIEPQQQKMTLSPISPFGMTTQMRGSLGDVSPTEVSDLVASHRVLVIRGLDTPTDDQMLGFAQGMGEVLLWNFGAFNELRYDPQAANYLYTDREVPLHWDGAFVGKIPRFIFFYCAASSGTSGGETTFCDTSALLDRLSAERRAQLATLSATYSTDKVAHYGGSFTSPMVQPHPVSGDATIRYAEPVDDINPVSVEVHGLADTDQSDFVADMRAALYHDDVMYAHRWQQGDMLIADNHGLLHGRRAFGATDARHLRRLNIL